MEISLSTKNLATAVLLIIAISFLGVYFFPSLVFAPKPKLEHKTLTPEYIISAAYKVYGNEKLGMWVAKTIATNTGDIPLYNVKFGYKIQGYSDWAESTPYPVLLPNSTIVHLHYPILSSEITKLTTSTPSKIDIKITYSEKLDGPQKELTENKPISLLGAHDIIYSSIPPEENTGSFYDIFDNFPLVAAWVTPTDPILMRYADLGNKLAGGAGADLSDEDAIKSINGMWELSLLNNIQYKTEPGAYWTGEFSQYLKYPRDVIRDRIGTCIDTSIFFASLALSQGLEAYIVLIPGHAFPVIKLPKSGRFIPIESTMLNSKVSFEEAVKGGEQSWQKAMSGPYIIMDVQDFQSKGITPPELENLPPDTLEKWNIVGTGGGTTSNPVGSTGTTSTNSGKYTSQTPTWSVSYPTGSIVQKPLDNEVDIYSADGSVEFLVTWGAGLTKTQAKAAIISLLQSKMDSFVTISQAQGTISGVAADIANYEAGVGGKYYLATARYFESQGYGFAILCDYPEDYAGGSQKCSALIQSFTLGG